LCSAIAIAEAAVLFIHLLKQINMKSFIYIFITITLLVVSIGCRHTNSISQNNLLNQESRDAAGNPMLLGAGNRTGIEKVPYSEWFNKNYSNYRVDSATANLIKPLLKKRTITIFLGTWCGDSKREVPRFYKILDYCRASPAAIQLVMVSNHSDAYKQSPRHEEKGLNIFRVPTFIIREKGKEIGRIIESPVESLEKDLYKILKGIAYEPRFAAARYMMQQFEQQSAAAIDKKITETAAILKPKLSNSGELNAYGYTLLTAGEKEKALLIFRINTLLYPQVANVWDSLAEGYYKTGDMDNAKKCYSKVLELDPANANARQMLETLKQ
jgi:tetratricopeptide (TPR) repeat protein